MTKFLVDFLIDNGCKTQLLVATELGEIVYKKVGFKKISEYQCFDSEVDRVINSNDAIRKLKNSDLEDIYKLDLEANREDRKHLIDKYFQTGSGYFSVQNELLGFYLPDLGQGLILSKDNLAGIELLKLKHSQKGRRTLVPTENENSLSFLESFGLKKGDKSARMILGKDNKWNPKYVYSYGSGYCG